MSATQAPKLLRISVAADRLNVTRASLYRWVMEGRIPAVELGGPGSPLRIPADELGSWLRDNRVCPVCAAIEENHEPHRLARERWKPYRQAQERVEKAAAQHAKARRI